MKIQRRQFLAATAMAAGPLSAAQAAKTRLGLVASTHSALRQPAPLDATLTFDQVRAMVDEFAQSYEDPSEVVGWYYQDASRLKEARALVLEENIVAWVLEHAQVSDEATTLEKLMGTV